MYLRRITGHFLFLNHDIVITAADVIMAQLCSAQRTKSTSSDKLVLNIEEEIDKDLKWTPPSINL